jgi:hypothetical protein
MIWEKYNYPEKHMQNFAVLSEGPLSPAERCDFMPLQYNTINACNFMSIMLRGRNLSYFVKSI